VFLMQLQFS